MTEVKTKIFTEYVLPPSVVSKIDVSRLVTELEWIDGETTAAAVRDKIGVQHQAKPLLSPVLEEFVTQNQLVLDTSHDRAEVIKQLRLLKDKVPVIHMTFAVPADRESLQQLSAWVRTSVHPQAVISVGLQPALVAGVYLRTPNRIFDLSMRAMLKSKHSLLMQELEALRGRS